MEEVLPTDAHHLASNRLHVSVTNFKTGKNHLVSRFTSRDELIVVRAPTLYTLRCYFYLYFVTLANMYVSIISYLFAVNHAMLL